MDGYSPCKSPGWQRPSDLLKIRRLKQKKKVLQERLFDGAGGSSSKKKPKFIAQNTGNGINGGLGGNASNKSKSVFRIQPPPPDEQTCDDSTLMDLINMKNNLIQYGSKSSNSISDTDHSSPASTMSFSPIKTESLNLANQNSVSPLRHYLPSSQNESPSKRRQHLIPAPDPVSPFSSQRLKLKRGLKRKLNLDDDGHGGGHLNGDWSSELCLDWSLKSSLRIISENPFGWSSTNLKSSEESSGISSFVRCIDIDSSPGTLQNSQLDTSLGAQFHQCCLFWQHPNLPTLNLFPRDLKSSAASTSSQSSSSSLTRHSSASSTLNSSNNFIRFEEKSLEIIHLDWVESFRSAFYILRARQSPYFYLCAPQFTCLFCAAGTQGFEQIQVYLTPSSKSIRDALTKEGIKFLMPFYNSPNSSINEDSDQSKNNNNKNKDINNERKESDDEDNIEPSEWLDELGVSQDISLSNFSTSFYEEEKKKASMIIILGVETLNFFNFLINSKNLLTASTGPLAGIPPTILSPITFHGATLKKLKVKQTKTKSSEDDKLFYTIEMTGPILPHVMHSLCNLLKKTVFNFKIHQTTLDLTKIFNVNSMMRKQRKETEGSSSTTNKANVFELQNLSDCGLKRDILEIFCKSNNCDTINKQLECKNGFFKWS